MKHLLDRLGLGRPDLRAWAMYDWANSAYQTTIIAAIFPVYYKAVAASGLDKDVATARWSWASAIAIIIVAIVAPVLGAIADNSPVKKRLLGVFMGIGVASCFGNVVDHRGRLGPRADAVHHRQRRRGGQHRVL